MLAPSPLSAASEEARAYTLQAIAPQPFGKYVLVGKLGHGGMAEVNLAVTGGKGGFRKLFVIKRLHAHLEAEPGFVDMFLDEARLAAQLDHPHCVQTVEVGEVNGQHFLCMEYLDGQGLERLLRMAASRNESIPPALAARIALDALDGLGYAHELSGFDGRPLGVVHRDISPQNLYITYTGVVKVLDFGIAKAASNVVETRTGVIKGKYAYIAPEQALATSPTDARADLWSMGVVLWEMLTTRRLFKSVNELATLQETLRAEIKPPSFYEPGVPAELDAICLRALQRDPEQRYRSAGHFKADLEAWLIAQPNPPERRAIAALMKERFEPIAAVQKQKLRECLEAVAEGKTGSVERLIEAGGAIASTELSAVKSPAVHTSSGVVLAPAAHGPEPTPTPPPMARPTVPMPAPLPMGAPGPLGVLGPSPTPQPLLASWEGTPPPGTIGADEPTFRAPPPADRSRPLGVWLVAIAALLLAGVIGAVFFGRGEEPTPGPALVVSAPAAGTVVAVPTAAAVPPAAAAMPPAAAVPPAAAAVPPAAAAVPPAAAAEAPALDGPPPVVPPDPGPAGSEPLDRSPAASAERRVRVPREEPEAPSETSAPPPASSGDGYLVLVTSPWTNVTCNGSSLGTTPIMRASLAPGHYSCRLTNPDDGVAESYEFDIRAGETTRVRLGLR